MAKGSNASPEVFGFDFQVNATIFLLLDNIKNVKTVRMEGASEDIELTMNDGNQIMAQAKGVVRGSSDFSNVRRNTILHQIEVDYSANTLLELLACKFMAEHSLIEAPRVLWVCLWSLNSLVFPTFNAEQHFFQMFTDWLLRIERKEEMIFLLCAFMVLADLNFDFFIAKCNIVFVCESF